ncbi:hypothetical protein JTM32_34200, partial [Pseudomonas aeruginosa]|nr:hypothetical protein [Pseudomonas aeruginosa]MBN0581261.1 hypothetical protein [Pseudomonas aeruginosa]MBN0631377.1 hypothetical protein [Pseudomonas aeruginosa]MBN0694054.1 hypothetical protein [Pseudomonas aeruginosa]
HVAVVLDHLQELISDGSTAPAIEVQPGDHSELRRIAVALKNPLLSGEEASDLMVRYEALTMPDHIIALIDGQAQFSLPQAWLDVQAERRRQIEAKGYQQDSDDHYISYELSKAARTYIECSWHALSNGKPFFDAPSSWPWLGGFKWSDGRRMLVKACALVLAEIERLDRALSSEGSADDER